MVEKRPGSEVEGPRWGTIRRCAHLRIGLHDPVKKALGDKYSEYFKLTPFAHYTAPKGTTGRLDAWFQSLVRCINCGALSPAMVARTLQLLDGPGVLHPENQNMPITAALFGGG